MPIQRDDLVERFWKRAPERVDEATDLWLGIENGDAAKLTELRRLLHTIKGEAQMLGIDDCARILELSEKVVDQLARLGRTEEGVGDALLSAFESLGVRASTSDPNELDLSPVIDELEAALVHIIATELEPIEAEERADTETDGAEEAQTGAALARAEPTLDGGTRPEAHHEITDDLDQTAPREGSTATRTRARGELDADEVSPVLAELRRLQGEQPLLLADLAEAQRRLRALLSEIRPDLGVEALRERIVKTLGYGAEIERALTALRTSWSANEFSTSSALDQLTEVVQRASLVSTGELESQVHRVARQTARAVGKEVDVEVRGDALVDASIERTLRPCLVHLVRNAVDHGLEHAVERVAMGKSPRGKLTITFTQSESSVRATVRDDGAGIDFTRLREVLASRGVDASAATEAELAQMLFAHGVSTRETASEISGRGIGLDVVAKELSEIGGTVLVESVRGRGSTFVLEMPATMRADVVVPVRTRSVHAAVPARTVLRVARVDHIEHTSRGPVIQLPALDREETDIVPLFALQALLEGTGEPQVGDTAVVIQGSRDPFAVTVLGFQNPRPVTFKRTQELPVRSRLVRGMSLQADGSVLLLLDVDALGTATAEPTLAVARSDDSSVGPMPTPRVLVVEDAPVARELLSGVLRSFGLRVAEAVDGRDGLASALDDPPDLVLTDIEMPYMDGLEMIRRLREDRRFLSVPVVVLTTRTDPETRARAHALGVVRFLSKQRFVEHELRDVVADCLGWR